MISGSTAIGETPTINPPGNGVGPTFTALTVNGPTIINGGISNSGTTANGSNVPVKVDDDLYVTGDITNPDAVNLVFGAIALSNDPITVKGDLKMIGTGNIDVGGKILNTKQTGAGVDLPVAIFDALELYGGISTPNAGAVTVGDDLVVSGSSDFAEAISNSTDANGGAILVEDDNGLHIKSTADVVAGGSASLKITDPNNAGTWMAIDRNEMAAYGGKLYLNLDSGTDVNVGSSNDKANLQVFGKVRADQFGTYDTEHSAAKTISATNNNQTAQSVSCPAGTFLVSCYTAMPATNYIQADNVTWHTWGKHFTMTGNSVNGNTCTAYVVTLQNLGVTNATFKAAAVCLDPDTF